jgi:hypothetical protein
METQQMMELLLARMDVNVKGNQDLLARMEAKIDANREANPEERKAERKAFQEEMTKANQEKSNADREHMQQIMAKRETDREEMMTKIDANQERNNASLR